MLKKLSALFCALLLAQACALPASASMEVEDDIDITDLVEIVEEEIVRDKKDSDGAYLMTITCAGDFTIGKDMNHKDIFTPELKKNDGNINFVMQNVKSIFTEDDLTLINFEGTLTESTFKPKSKTKDDFIFSISPSYASVLPDNGVEAVCLDNNHVLDHGEEGLEDTKQALRDAGVIYSTPLETGVFNYRGIIQVAMLSYNCIDRYGTGFKSSKFAGQYTDAFLQHDTFEEAVCAEIEEAKRNYAVVIVSFHWGREKDYAPTQNQIRLGRMAADAGADLVIGHHSHRIQPIEYYNGTLICYSLANFCFAGNSKPSDMSSFMLQARFRVKEDGSASFKDFIIIPFRISSTKSTNNFIPTPFESGAERDSILNTMRDPVNIKNLPYAVTDLENHLKFQ
ncbi:MAG: CapA family protein [Clostridia bacterium]|nr:CapA family protein [Clostridia bacterium]